MRNQNMCNRNPKKENGNMGKSIPKWMQPKKGTNRIVVYSPVEIQVTGIDGKNTNRRLRGALMPKKTIDSIIRIIHKYNANGIGKDSILLLALENASASLAKK